MTDDIQAGATGFDGLLGTGAFSGTGGPATALGQSGQIPAPTPAVTLPRGGGALRGIDEKFSAVPANGTATLSVPVYATPGRSDFYPQLSLTYDSGAGNGPYGLGWQLTTIAISRKTSHGIPRYDDARNSDTFVLQGAEDLVPVSLEDGRFEERRADGYRIRRYRPRVEGAFARIEHWTDEHTGDAHWRTVSKENVTTIYGRTASRRIADPGDPRRVFVWLVEEMSDDAGTSWFTTTYRRTMPASPLMRRTTATAPTPALHTRSVI